MFVDNKGSYKLKIKIEAWFLLQQHISIDRWYTDITCTISSIKLRGLLFSDIASL